MDARRHYYGMLAVSAVYAVIEIVYRTNRDDSCRYCQYLVDYDLGFMRRALAGEIASYVFPQISNLTVCLISVVFILIAAWAYYRVFQRDFGFSNKTLPFFALLLSSPFFFKEFVHLVGFFDVIAFSVACLALLLRVGPLYPAIIAAASAGLILIHHLNFLLFCPVIGFICFVRYMVARDRFSAMDAAYIGACALFIAITFIFVVKYGASPVPREVLLEHMRSRALDDFGEYNVGMWTRTLSEEMSRTADRLGGQALYLPLYAFQVFIHLPLILYFRQAVQSVVSPMHRRIIYAGLVGVTLGYIPIFVVVYDYNRWLACWAVCMLLIIHALRALPVANGEDAPIEADRKRNIVFGWLLAVNIFTGATYPIIA